MVIYHTISPGPETETGSDGFGTIVCAEGGMMMELVKSNRNDPDSDDDGLLDGEEFQKGTNPREVDTDKDGNITGDAYNSSTDNASKTLFLPELWTRNIDGGIRQRIPLAVDGRFVHERSPVVSEYKMRRLRRKPNQALLLGGRM